MRYVKTKFARAMLDVLKVTQHNPAQYLEVRPEPGLHVRLGHRLDQVDPGDRRPTVRQVRADAEEIAFIEAKVKPMD